MLLIIVIVGMKNMTECKGSQLKTKKLQAHWGGVKFFWFKVYLYNAVSSGYEFWKLAACKVEDFFFFFFFFFGGGGGYT